MRAARCSCWPGRAPARPPRSSRRWRTGSSDRGIDPARVLVLTFSRKAAGELRERITARLRRTTREPLALTFHSYAYALVRREFALAGRRAAAAAVRRPSSCSRSAGCCAARLAGRGPPRWPERLRPPWPPAGSPRSCATSCSAPPSAAWTAAGWRRLGRAHGRDDWVAAGRLPRPVRGALRPRAGRRLRLRGDRPDRGRPAEPGGDPRSVSARPTTSCWWTSTRTRDPAQESLLHALAGDGRELIAVGRSRPVDLRLPRRRRARHHRVP